MDTTVVTGEPHTLVNRAIRSLQERDSEWPLSELAAVLYAFSDLFNETFFGCELEPAAISIERGRINVLGHYRLGRDGLGLQRRINLNAEHLGRPLVAVLRTLCHEQIHQWQEQRGTLGSRPSYHNVEFTTKAAAIGIPVQRGSGIALGPPRAPFTDLLKRHGVPIGAGAPAPQGRPNPTPNPPVTPRRKGRSTLRLWVCPCGIKLRVGRRELRARCLDCNGDFALASP